MTGSFSLLISTVPGPFFTLISTVQCRNHFSTLISTCTVQCRDHFLRWYLLYEYVQCPNHFLCWYLQCRDHFLCWYLQCIIIISTSPETFSMLIPQCQNHNVYSATVPIPFSTLRSIAWEPLSLIVLCLIIQWHSWMNGLLLLVILADLSVQISDISTILQLTSPRPAAPLEAPEFRIYNNTMYG
jgi:hypothetical protein